MNTNPGFSIIMPTYNRAFCICRAIDSLLQQKYSDFELIIVDDGSTDGTEALIRDKYAAELSAGTIVYVYGEHEGVSQARNKALSLARHEWIGYLDSDNLSAEKYFVNFAEAIRQMPAKMYYGQSRHIESGKIVGRKYDARELCLGCYIDMNVFLHSREVYAELGGFDETMNRLVDWELILRYSRSYTPQYIAKIQVDYCDSNHFTRISNSRDAEKMREIIFQRYLPPLPPVEKKPMVIVVDFSDEKIWQKSDLEFNAFMKASLADYISRPDKNFNLLLLCPEAISLFARHRFLVLQHYYSFIRCLLVPQGADVGRLIDEKVVELTGNNHGTVTFISALDKAQGMK